MEEIKKIIPRKVGKKFYIKMYGTEYELVLPTEEETVMKKVKKTKKQKVSEPIK